MLFLHRRLLFGDSHLPSFDTSRMQVTPTSNSRAFGSPTKPTIWTTTSIRLGIEKASFPTSSAFHEICWHHTGATRYLGTPIHQYFQRHARNTHNLLRDARVQQGTESNFPHITASQGIAGSIRRSQCHGFPTSSPV